MDKVIDPSQLQLLQLGDVQREQFEQTLRILRDQRNRHADTIVELQVENLALKTRDAYLVADIKRLEAELEELRQTIATGRASNNEVTSFGAAVDKGVIIPPLSPELSPLHQRKPNRWSKTLMGTIAATIDDKVVKQLRTNNVPDKEIAAHFGVSLYNFYRITTPKAVTRKIRDWLAEPNRTVAMAVVHFGTSAATITRHIRKK